MTETLVANDVEWNKTGEDTYQGLHRGVTWTLTLSEGSWYLGHNADADESEVPEFFNPERHPLGEMISSTSDLPLGTASSRIKAARRRGSVLVPEGMRCGTCAEPMPCVAPVTPLQECAACIRSRRDAVPELLDAFRQAQAKRVHGSNGGAQDWRAMEIDALRAALGQCGFVTPVERKREERFTIFHLEQRIEDLHRQLHNARVENARAKSEVFHQAAEAIRRSVNDRTMPSRYRREGALTAADWIDPNNPASPYTQI